MSGSSESKIIYTQPMGPDADLEFFNLPKNITSQIKNDSHYSKDVKIVIYESFCSSPRINTIQYISNTKKYIEKICQETHMLCQQFTFSFPYPIIKSLIENFIHTDFCEPIISIFNEGKTIRLSDQGSGIPNKDIARQVGFSTANSQQKDFIPGVGSGFPSIIYYSDMMGGNLNIEDNIKKGSVITLDISNNTNSAKDSIVQKTQTKKKTSNNYLSQEKVLLKSLSERQQEVLVAVTDCGLIGPSQLAEIFEISVATAYRDLQCLEHLGYVRSEAGKRTITKDGLFYLETYIFGNNPYN